MSLSSKELERQNEVFTFLDMLQETGKTNMIGAGPYLVEHLGMGRCLSQDWVLRWIQRETRILQLDSLLRGNMDAT